MSDQFIGQVLLFGCNFAPNGFASCSGQLLPINQNTALFSLLGTFYGRQRHHEFRAAGSARPRADGIWPRPGLQNYIQGETGGSETITLDVSQIPAHSHAIDTTALAATAKVKSGMQPSKRPWGTYRPSKRRNSRPK